MLQLRKNKIVTQVSKGQVEIRQMEVDWYCGNYQTISGQAAMLAGFAFNFLTAPMPKDKEPCIWLEFFYFFCVSTALGAELGVIVISSYLSVWAPSLALRGKRGAVDLHKACDTLRDYQALVFSCFMCGWIVHFIASILQVWIFYKRSIATFVSIPFLLFTVAIIWYLVDLRQKLSLSETEVVTGKISHFQPYEQIGDLDHGLAGSGQPTRAGGSRGAYCRVQQDAPESLQPRSSGS
ncbi:hypothetical protein AK812_SmicGene13065 [Symbiodinium microadriaticum]|uniref:Uncharacterized protein n=2 Tax=Symbiodinium TaxID=2949 RepID=A0A1Q9E956_SYMMI|nr:hypothetical protein AK812_SmicGene13065 [Symbiodinium microadriaticum]